jgi:hypothetical protein
MANSKLPAFYRGDTPLIRFPLTLNGSTLDLTGYTAIFTMTANPAPTTDSDKEIQIVQSPVPNPTLGVLDFQFTNAQTQNLDPNKTHYWDLQLKDPTGQFFYTILSGTVKVKVDYTRNNA